MQVAFPYASVEKTSAASEFVVHVSERSRIYLEYYGSKLDDIGWSEEEIDLINHLLPLNTYHIYSIAYHSMKAAKEAIVSLADSSDLLVDNDCGTLLPGHEFVSKVRQNPDWNWFDDL